MSKAFEILAKQYRPMVFSYLRALLRDHHLAEDLAQETMIAAQRSLDRFDDSGDFGAWLRGIARNKVLEDRRAFARRPLVVDSRVVEGMEEVYAAFDGPGAPWEEQLQVVRTCISRLSDKLRHAVEHVYAAQCSLQEAATNLGVSFPALAQRLSRARSLIRQCVAAKTHQNPQELHHV